MGASRTSIWFNDEWPEYSAEPDDSVQDAYHFHQTLPDYKPTPLHSLTDLASEIGVKAIYLKDEGNRFGLPSFKILGASWGTFRALAERLSFPLDSSFEEVKTLTSKSGITLYAATDGNHGRAVSRIGRWFGLPTVIHVPANMIETTVGFIESEGANVVRSKGSYDDAVAEADHASRENKGLLVQDFAFGDYDVIPQWIVDGYHTMMLEIDQQLGSQQVTHAFAPIGVGSFASAVTTHFRSSGKTTRVIAVESENAPCMLRSLENGRMTTIETTTTIMSGLECGTVSTIAWPILSKGLAASMTVSDVEAHSACVYLKSQDIPVGPCGASPVAALRRLSAKDKERLAIDGNSVVVLPCTEGARPYNLPVEATV